MEQLSCSFATNCRTKCHFSRARDGNRKAPTKKLRGNIVPNSVSDSEILVLKCQYPPHKSRRHKLEREVNLKMAEEIKAGGESSW